VKPALAALRQHAVKVGARARAAAAAEAMEEARKRPHGADDALYLLAGGDDEDTDTESEGLCSIATLRKRK
jgi:hypothetical protein